MTLTSDIIVVGAGLAGLTVAAGLAAANRNVVVLEKSRGTGGRLATRRVGEMRFDHGAQYLKPVHSGYAEFLRQAVMAGAADAWPAIGETAHIGLPGMGGLVKPLAQGLDIRTGCRVGAARRGADGWRLADPDGTEIARCGSLVVTAPAPQAAAMLDGHAAADRLGEVVFAPNWTLMVALADRPGLPEASRDETKDLSWIARDSGKPGRPAAPECWVAQSSAAFARETLERDATDVCGDLVHLFAEAAGGDLPPPVHAAAHRWRYSHAETPLGQPCLHDPEAGLVVAGDYCLGTKAEHAWLSAQAALDVLLPTTADVAPERRA